MAALLGMSLQRDPTGQVVADQPRLAELAKLHHSMAEAMQVFVRYAVWR
jgi:hypothetical protein